MVSTTNSKFRTVVYVVVVFAHEGAEKEIEREQRWPDERRDCGRRVHGGNVQRTIGGVLVEDEERIGTRARREELLSVGTRQGADVLGDHQTRAGRKQGVVEVR